MKRACFYLRLYPGTEAKYARRHSAIWPEQQAAIKDAGIRNMSGFRRGTDVWYYAECQPDAKTAFAKLGAAKANLKWNDSFRPIIAELTQADGERIWFEEIFHTNGGGAGPFERGLFALVVHPDRLPGDDPRHAEPRPEKVAELDQAGFPHYTRFRPRPPVRHFRDIHSAIATARRAHR